MGLNGLLMESVSKKTISFVQIHVLHDNRHHNAGYTGRQKVKLHKQTNLSNKHKYLSMQLSSEPRETGLTTTHRTARACTFPLPVNLIWRENGDKNVDICVNQINCF